MALSTRAAVPAGSLPPGFVDLEQREGVFGAANLAMILALIGLAVFRPGLRRGGTNPNEPKP